MSRLAEKIRNTEPWCVALLKAPPIHIESKGAYLSASVPLRMPWEPGFVISSNYTVDAQRVINLGSGEIEKSEAGPRSIVITLQRYGTYKGPHLQGFENSHVMACVYMQGVANSELGLLRVSRVNLIEGECLGNREFFLDRETLEILHWEAQSLGMDPLDKASVVKLFASNTHFALARLENILQLLSCKNVHIEERKNPPKRRTKGKNKRHVESYHVLNIPGSPRYWERSPSDGLSGIQHRLHVCRGHFKTYTKDAPLFGRTVGTVWVPSHARGNADLGFADKDYNLTEATK